MVSHNRSSASIQIVVAAEHTACLRRRLALVRYSAAAASCASAAAAAKSGVTIAVGGKQIDYIVELSELESP